MIRETLFYIWLNVIPVADYYIAPGSEIAAESYFGSSSCTIEEIHMDGDSNIEIVCKEIVYDKLYFNEPIEE